MNTQNTKNKFILWVGGIPNLFETLLDAEIQQKEWINKGYNKETLIIEKQ